MGGGHGQNKKVGGHQSRHARKLKQIGGKCQLSSKYLLI
jgi:hypothetical protein